MSMAIDMASFFRVPSASERRSAVVWLMRLTLGEVADGRRLQPNQNTGDGSGLFVKWGCVRRGSNV